MKETNIDKLKSHLQFLIDGYSFILIGEQYFPELMGNAFVKYSSSSVGVLVVCDRDQVFCQIGLISWPENEWFQLEDIIRYYYPKLELVYIFEKSINDQLEHITSFLQGVCRPLILGDFAMKDQIREVERQRVKKMLRNFGIDTKESIYKG